MHFRKKTILLLAIISLALPPAVTSGDSAIEAADSVEFIVYPFGTVRRKAIWTTRQIEVCWENPNDISDDMRSLVMVAIQSTWEKYSQLSFIGWNSCVTKQNGIHISIEDERPHVRSLGRYLNQRTAGMVLNFNFNSWKSECSTSTAKEQACARQMSVHEFGHAIGFAHEHLRPEAPPECMAEKIGTRGDWNVTDYDGFSIMNYCRPDWAGDGTLSSRDILAVQTVYGKRA